MSGNIPPVDFHAATEKQIELWNASRKVTEDVGEEVFTRTEPPVIVADETIGSHEYDEAKAERDRQNDAPRPDSVEQVRTINQDTKKLLPGTGLDGHESAWDDLADRGAGIYAGIHPTMEREGVYVYGCPHLLVFEEERPVQVIRLRGTKYVDRPAPYPSQLVGPWLTCRILERGRFDVRDLEFTIIRYDRREYTDSERKAMLTQLQHGYATDGKVRGIDVSAAVEGFSDLQVNTYEYQADFTHESTDFARRLSRSLSILRGETPPEGQSTLDT